MKKGLFTTDEFGRSAEPEHAGLIDAPEKKRSLSNYDKYFDGYITTVVPRDNGIGKKVVRTYIGPLYRQVLTEAQRRENRVKLTVLYLSSVAALIAALVVPAASNTCWYVMLAVLAPLVFFGRDRA
jgi:hypothetical protein